MADREGAEDAEVGCYAGYLTRRHEATKVIVGPVPLPGAGWGTRPTV
jgi:hypothetical protein